MTFILAACFTHAQNLVPNPSFEDTVNCPTSIGQLYNAMFWVNPTQCTPDYFNLCSTANGGVVHVPNNGFGNQAARTGNAYAGFYAFNKAYPDTFREYIQTYLSSNLIASHQYKVSFYLSLSEASQYGLSSVGVYFSTSIISSSNSGIINYSPQIQNKTSNILVDKTNWMLVEDTINANGGEFCMTIGNFMTDSSSDTLFLGNIGGNNITYYYIDDVSVLDLGPVGIKNNNVGNDISIYPNPVQETLNIDLKRVFPGSVVISDIASRELISEPLVSEKQRIDVSFLDKGIYFISLFDVNKRMLSIQKFIKE